jgi:hypothetical protein
VAIMIFTLILTSTAYSIPSVEAAAASDPAGNRNAYEGELVPFEFTFPVDDDPFISLAPGTPNWLVTQPIPVVDFQTSTLDMPYVSSTVTLDGTPITNPEVISAGVQVQWDVPSASYGTYVLTYYFQAPTYDAAKTLFQFPWAYSGQIEGNEVSSAGSGIAVYDAPLEALAPNGDEITIPNVAPPAETFVVRFTNTHASSADTFSWTIDGGYVEDGAGASGSVGPLAAGATSDVTFSYSPSGTGDFTGTLSATSSLLGCVDTLVLTTHVVDYAPNLEAGPSVERVLLGNDVTHTISITNDGDVTDTFTLSYTGDQSGTTSFSPVSINSLAAAGTTTFDLVFTAPIAGTHTGTVTATSQGYSGSTDTITITTEVQSAGVDVTPVTSTETGSKDANIVHTLTVENTGNFEDTYDIAVTGGVGTLSDATLTIAAGATDTFTVTEPQDGTERDNVITTVSVTSQADGTVDDTATTDSSFKNYQPVVTILETNPQDLLDGGTTSYTFRITNGGGLADSFTWALTGDAGYSTLDTSPTATLGVGASEDITVSFADPESGSATVRTYDGIITATSTNAAVLDAVTATTNIVSYEPAIQTPGVVEWYIPIGDTVSVALDVVNDGDRADTFSWTMESGDPVSGTTASTAPAATETINFDLVGATLGLGTHVLTFDVESDNDATKTDTIDFTVHVVAYDVTQTTPTASRTMAINDVPESFTVTLTNSGDGPDTYDVSISGAGYTITGGAFTTGTIAIGAATTFEVVYTASGTEGLYAGTVNALSNTDGAVDHDLALSVQEWDYQLTAPAAPSPSWALDGIAKSYTLTWTNPGNVAVNVDFTYTGVGTLLPTSGTIAAGGTLNLTLSYPGLTTGTDPAAETITGTVDEDNTVTDAVIVDHDVRDYSFTFVKDLAGRMLAEEGGTTAQPLTFDHTGTHVGQYTITSTIGASTPAAFTPGVGGSQAITHDLDAVDLATAGTYTGTITVTSDDDPRKTLTIETSTWVTPAANHETEVGAGTGIYDHVATLGVQIDLTSSGTHTIDMWKLTENPDDERPAPKSVYYGAFVVSTSTGISDFHVTLSLPRSILGGADINKMDAFLLSPAGIWSSATSGDFVYDRDTELADFTILGADWSLYGSDYVAFAIAAKAEFIGLPPVIIPDPIIPDDATTEEVSDAITDATEGQSADVVADVILTETEDKTTDETADIVLAVTEDKTTEETAEIVTEVVADKTVEEAVEIVLTVIEDKTTEETAEIVTEVVADKTVEEAAEIVVEVVADKTVEEAAEIVAEVVADKTVEEAAEIVKSVVTEQDADEAAEIIAEVIAERPVEEKVEVVLAQDTDNAAATLDAIEVEDAVDIMDSIIPTAEELEDATEEEKAEVQAQVEEAAEIMNEVEPEKAAEVLLESSSSEKAKTIVEEMAKADINKAAQRLEDAVKIQKKTGEITPQQKTAYRKQLKEIVEAGDAEAMANLFVAIANLPDTPSTVAEIFEIIDIEKTMTIIDIVSAQGSHEELALVYSFLSDAKLTEIWTAMTTAVRTAVYPYFDAATLGNLPELTTFTVSVSVSPDTVETGEPVTVTATVSNTGDETGDVWVTMTEGSIEESEIVTLDAGASTTLTWTITKAAAGSYTVDVNGDTASFTVEAPLTPAAFTLSDLSVSPASIQAGDDVTVTVEVENTGEESGSTTVEVVLEGVEADSELVTLDGGASITVSFTVTSETEGAHTVEVGNLSADFTVEEAPAGTPWTYILVGIVVVAAAAYLYMQQNKEE